MKGWYKTIEAIFLELFEIPKEVTEVIDLKDIINIRSGITYVTTNGLILYSTGNNHNKV